jgi:hypothetical protein
LYKSVKQVDIAVANIFKVGDQAILLKDGSSLQ